MKGFCIRYSIMYCIICILYGLSLVIVAVLFVTFQQIQHLVSKCFNKLIIIKKIKLLQGVHK